MKVRLKPPTVSSDQFHLIKTDQLMLFVDKHDLAQRNSLTIVHAYHKHWLSKCEGDIFSFHAPQFYINDGTIKFINGRHRTLLLSEYMKEIPMALTSMDIQLFSSNSSRQNCLNCLQKISIKRISEQDIFDFPDLPIRYLGYDENIGM